MSIYWDLLHSGRRPICLRILIWSFWKKKRQAKLCQAGFNEIRSKIGKNDLKFSQYVHTFVHPINKACLFPEVFPADFWGLSSELYKSTQNLRCRIFVKKISIWSLIFSLYKHPSFVTHMNKERMRLYLGNWTENSAIKNNNQAEISTIQHDRIFPYEQMAKFVPLTRQTW